MTKQARYHLGVPPGEVLDILTFVEHIDCEKSCMLRSELITTALFAFIKRFIDTPSGAF